MKTIIVTIFAAVALLFSTGADAQTVDQREVIDVGGIAEIKVVPNEFVLRSNITVFDKSLASAGADNDRLIAKAFKSLSALGVERKYIVTDAVDVNVVTQGYRQEGNFRRVGFNVSRDVMVVLHDAKKIEPAMRALFALGVDRLNVTMGHTKMNELLENAQIKAASEARQKAKLLSSALGRTLGKAVLIEETAAGRNEAQNFVYSANTPDLGDTLSLGKIRVQAAVRVKFLLT